MRAFIVFAAILASLATLGHAQAEEVDIHIPCHAIAHVEIERVLIPPARHSQDPVSVHFRLWYILTEAYANEAMEHYEVTREEELVNIYIGDELSHQIQLYGNHSVRRMEDLPYRKLTDGLLLDHPNDVRERARSFCPQVEIW